MKSCSPLADMHRTASSPPARGRINWKTSAAGCQSPAESHAPVMKTLPSSTSPIGAAVPPQEPARWLEACSPDPDHPCYAGHQGWATEVAAGYATALAVHDTEATKELLWAQDVPLLREGTFVVPAGQLSEWVLDDLEGETSDVCG